MPLLDIIIPEEIGPVEECVVVTWLKQEGDPITKGEDLLIVQAEKTSFDIPAPATGTVVAILAQQGEVVTQKQVLARLEVSEAQLVSNKLPAEPPAEPALVAPPASDVRASPIAKRLAREHGINLAEITGTGNDGRITEKDVQLVIEAKSVTVLESPLQPSPPREVRVSPVAKRIAREHNIDLAKVPATGSSERITEKDVRAYIEAQQAIEQSAPVPPTGEVKTIPLAGMRGAIAERMHQSLQDMAQLTLHTEADVTQMVALRQQLKQNSPVTYTDLIVKATAVALGEHPRVNATLDGNVIKLLSDIHIGLAVALEDGLIVPVIRNADQKSLEKLAAERGQLVDKARLNQLTAEEMTGGTFTITNMGTYDIDAFTPIVNPPEAAILGVGRILDKVVIYQGKIAQRSMMTLSLSFDHRLLDGAPAAAFLQRIKQLLAEPEQLL